MTCCYLGVRGARIVSVEKTNILHAGQFLDTSFKGTMIKCILLFFEAEGITELCSILDTQLYCELMHSKHE